MAPHYAGAVLAPWPNRVFGAWWDYQGQHRFLDMNEPGTLNALHGFVAGTHHHVAHASADTVTLIAEVHQRPGYPFDLTIATTYTLDDDGLTVAHAAGNLGTEAAPVAFGAHPFVAVPGLGRSDDTIVTIDAAKLRDAAGALVDPPARYDLRSGQRLSEYEADDCYGAITRGTDGCIRATVDTPAGTLELWAREPFGWLQVYTTRGFPGVDDKALAIEPMTAPPNALQTGEDLIWVEPDADVQVEWGLRLQPV